MTGKTPTRKPRLRWWQWLCRAAILLALLLAAAYATLPWWAPTGWLGREICRRLSAQAGCEVRLTDLRLSWASGVEIRGLAIDPPGGGPVPLASVRVVRTELSPVRLLLNKDLGCVELIEPKIDLAVDANGRTNLEPLARLAGDVTPSGFHVERAIVSLRLPDEPEPLALRVASMEIGCRAGGQLAMSASLGQGAQSAAAPMSLSAQASPGGGASASLTFSNLDLSKLPLARQANLPLKRFAGRADGALELRVNPQGIVDAFRCRLRVRRLDVQPEANVQLPVVDEAVLDVSATYDHITKVVRVQTARIRLPGVVDLSGQADVGAGLLDGHWEAIESLDLSGQVQPAKLAAMLAGRQELPGDLAILGPVKVTVRARQESRKLDLRLSADATGAEIRRGERVLKPAGRNWDMGLAGDLDHRTTGFDVRESWLHIASNRFTGCGALVSLRGLAEQLTDPNRGEIGQTLLSALARLNWHGEWAIDDMDALLDLAAPADRPAELADMTLAGPLTGRWYIHHGPATQVRASFHAGPDARVALPGRFVQPPGVPLDLSLGVAIDPNTNDLKDLTFDLAAGPARLEGLKLVLARAGDSGPLRIDGSFSAERIEDLLACVPGTDELRRGLAGTAKGRVSLEADRCLRRLNASVNLKDTRIDLGPRFLKEAGLEGQLAFELLPLDGQPAPRQMTGIDTSHRQGTSLTGRWLSPQADMSFKFRYAADDANALLPIPADGNTVAWSVEAHVKDASQIARYSPVLAELLAGAALGGTMDFNTTGRTDGQNLHLDATCDASDLSLASPAGAVVGRRKPSGTPLRIRVQAHADLMGGQLFVNIGRLDIDYAASRASLNGWAIWPGGVLGPLAEAGPDGDRDRKARADDWQPKRCDLDANASLVLDGGLRALAPEIDSLLTRYGVTGRCRLDLTADADANGLQMTAGLDAADLAVEYVAPPPEPGTDPNSLAAKLAAVGPLRKRAKTPALVELDLSCPRDLARLRVHHLLVRARQVQLLAGGTIARPDESASAGAPPKVDLHASLSTPRAETLQQFAPALRAYGLSGGFLLDVSSADLTAGRIDRAILRLDKLQARVAGKNVLADGTCIVDGVDAAALLKAPALADTAATTQPAVTAWTIPLPDIARVRCEALEFRIGRSHGWLVADVSNIPSAAKGNIHLLAERFDSQELENWLAEPNAPKVDPVRPWKLTDAEHRVVETQARRLASLMATHLAEAELTARFTADRFRTYDKSVMLAYDVRHVDFSAKVDKGRFTLSYTGGLNGGLLHDTAAGDLTDPNRPVQCESIIDDILAEDNIQPQLAKFFPSNTIKGSFSKREKTVAPLIDLLAVSLDARWPIIRIGANKTVAIEGLTQGRAAPQFVTKVFPGLNLTKYPYEKMTAFADLRPDGMVYNDMVFSGKAYDLYMEGTTDVSGIARYEIGLILLGTPQSAEWNHTYRQGRIPLLNFQARIDGGKMHDEQVSYLWPNEALFTIFLKNNIFYRIWLASGNNRKK